MRHCALQVIVDGNHWQVAYSTPLGVTIITPFQLKVRTALRWVSLLLYHRPPLPFRLPL